MFACMMINVILVVIEKHIVDPGDRNKLLWIARIHLTCDKEFTVIKFFDELFVDGFIICIAFGILIGKVFA